MPHRLEITLKPGLFDAEGHGIRNKTLHYFGINIDVVRTIQVITIDAALTPDQLIKVQTEIFTNPVTQVSAFTPLPPIIRQYFFRPSVHQDRAKWGLSDPTDIELEYLSQARSDHCNHNTFRGIFRYHNLDTGDKVTVNNLFKTCIEAPTLALKAQKPWVISVLWDNAGAARFDDDHYYVITGETHNSPSNMEAYGGAITGIVGVYRDPLGTGKGARLIMGSYGFCVGPRDYSGNLKPRLHPRRLLDGIIEGVRDGGKVIHNKEYTINKATI